MTVLGLALLAAPFVLGGYAYLGYPLILWVISRYSPPGSGFDSTKCPRISITLAAYNEEKAIGETLESLTTANYPPDRRQIIVISDASTDRTDEIVRSFADRGVELIRLKSRAGKTAAENASCARIQGEIVINTDAAVRVDPDALVPLVAAFADPSVGVASGRDISVGDAKRADNVGESGYVGYEMWVRDLETGAGSIVGASGCFYASRRDLHSELVPEELSRDFAAPLIAREHGYRSVSVPEARCYVPRTPALRREYRRKVRTMARGLDTLFFKRHLLNPVRHRRFAWMLFSHKLARWLVPWAAVLGLVGLAFLAFEQPSLRAPIATFIGVGAGVMAAAWWWPASRRVPLLVGAPAYVLFGLLAGVGAWVKAVGKDRSPVWEPTRR